MRRFPRIRISGRVAVVTLVIVSLAAAGGIFGLSKRALAAPGAAKPIAYGPVILQERSISGIHTVQIGLLVPAVQTADTQFIIEAIIPDGTPSALPVPRSSGPSMSFFDVFVESTIDGYRLTLRNRQTSEEATLPLATASTGLAIRILPGMQRNGQSLLPITANVQAMAAYDVLIGEQTVQLVNNFDIDPF